MIKFPVPTRAEVADVVRQRADALMLSGGKYAIDLTRVGAVVGGEGREGRGGQCPCGMGANPDKALGVMLQGGREEFGVSIRLSDAMAVCLYCCTALCRAGESAMGAYPGKGVMPSVALSACLPY
jgi:hypothetical protein